MRKLLLLSTIALLPCAAASDASAGSIFTYQYTGQPFNFFGAGVEASQFTGANRVTFDFSISAPIAPDTTYTMVDLSVAPNPTLLSWSMSDGTNSFSSLTGPLTQSPITGGGLMAASEVTTDASGSIASWDFAAQQAGGSYLPDGPPDQLEVTITSYSGSGEDDQINPPDGSYYLYSGGASRLGTWTETVSSDPVPEPGTLAILGVGLLGLLAAPRRAKWPLVRARMDV